MKNEKQNISLKSCLALLAKIGLLFQLLGTLFISSNYKSDALVFSVVLNALSLYVLFSNKKSSVSISKSSRIWLSLLSVLYVIMLSFAQLYRTTIHPLFKDYGSLLYIITIFWTFALYLNAYISLKYIFGLFILQKNLQTTELNKPYRPYLIIISIVSFLIMITAGWGYELYDTIDVYVYAQNNDFIDWHTISYQLLYKIIQIVFPNTFVLFLLIFQTVAWILVCKYALCSLYDQYKSAKVLKAYTLISLLIFTPYVYVALAIKDTIFSMFMLSFSVSLFNIIRKEKLTKKDYISLIITATLAGLFRHIAIELVVISLIAVYIYRLVKYKNYKAIKKAICTILVPIIVFVGITSGIGSGVLHMHKNPKYVSYTIPIYLSVASASKLGDEFGEENTEKMERIIPIEEWCEDYKTNIYWADEVARNWGEIGQNIYSFDEQFFEDVMDINIDMFTHHPLIYLESLFEITSIVWEIGKTEEYKAQDLRVDTNWKEITDDYSSYDNVANSLVSEIITSSAINPITDSILWRGGIWILAALFGSLVLLNKKRFQFAFVILPIVIYAATLFISVPAQDSRYILSFIEVGIFYLIIAFFEKGKNSNESNDLSKMQEQTK